jgi:ABC-2 type transport system permease protein
MLKNAMAVSLFIALVIGADTLSGERERATLESLLLTPNSRWQIIAGKFLAGISPWPVAFIIAIPFMKVLSQGDEILIPAIFWGAITGTVLVLAYTGIGMLVSFWSSSNKVSYFISLGIYVLFLVPAQLPGSTQAGAAGQFLQWINPLASVNHFLSKHLVNYVPLKQFWTWLISPVALFLLVSGLLFFYAAPNLRLEPGKTSRFWSYLTRLFGTSVIICFLLVRSVFPVSALPTEQSQNSDMELTIDLGHLVVKTGDKVEYNTVVTNNGTEASPSLIVAMNIINLNAQGEVVDPEDWSPQRTQYIQSAAPGESISLHWIINTILDGNYMIYMVLISRPETADLTSQPIASSGIHLTVTPYTSLNPGGVLPYAIGVPVAVLVITIILYRLRRRNIEMGDSA